MLHVLRQQLHVHGVLHLRVKIRERSRRTALYASLPDGAILMHVAAPAVDQKANKEIVRFLSRAFRVPQRNICIVLGLTSSFKRLRIVAASAC